MKKFIWLIAFFLVLALPIAMRRLERLLDRDHLRQHPRLVIITMQNRDICNEFRWAFSDWHQKHYGYPVEIDYLTPGGTSDVKRQLDSIYRSIRAAHGGQLPPESQTDSGIQLAWGGGDQFFEHELKPIGILRPLDLTQSQLKEIFPQPVLAGSNLYDQQRDPSGKFLPPRWVGVCLSSFGIVYNQDLCSALGVPAPTTWNALADPRLVGAVALADPTHSGTASVMYMIILQRAMADAEEQFLQSPANAGKDPVSLKKTPEYQSALDTGWKRGMQTLTLIAANAALFRFRFPAQSPPTSPSATPPWEPPSTSMGGSPKKPSAPSAFSSSPPNPRPPATPTPSPSSTARKAKSSPSPTISSNSCSAPKASASGSCE